MTKLVINPKVKKSKIHKEIYGHFSEHLGRCIYEGLYVGEDSPIPNVNGMRTDVVEALKKMKIPVLRWPGDVLRMSITGRTESGRKRAGRKLSIPTGVVLWRTTA